MQRYHEYVTVFANGVPTVVAETVTVSPTRGAEESSTGSFTGMTVDAL